ncbi:MAG: DUF4382 domain-containing protein [Chromatiales bacterium]|nr:DUF4382 domain-containing protein [Chromatiales bacterium]
MSTLVRHALLTLALAALAACGGGGGGSSGGAAPTTATVGIALTDAPTAGYDRALATITSIDLLGDNGKVNVFSGSETVDLLKLADYSELFAVQDNVPSGTYNKIRLQLSNLELVQLNGAGDADDVSTFPKLAGNGKIDLNPQGSFYVAPGATLVITIDFDVGKSLKITTTGNGKVIVRPVVFVDITSGLPSPGLTRIHGVVADIRDDGSFRLCQTRLASSRDDYRAVSRFAGDDGHCVRVRSDSSTGIFGDDGLPQEFFDLEEGEEVTAIGRLQPVPRNDDRRYEYFVLTAYVIEEGLPGTFERLRGIVDAPVDPGTDRFRLDVAPGQGIVSDGPLLAQLYPKSRIFSPKGVELGRIDIDAGASALVDSVLAIASGGPAILRTSLVILDVDGAAEEQVLTGQLVSVNKTTGQLIVAGPLGDRCVDARAADVFLIDSAGGSLNSQRGTLADLAPGQDVNVFGRAGTGGCLVAETILADR